MLKKQVSPKIVSLIFAILVICFAIAFYAFSWTGPTAPPPEGNVDPPINVGGTEQYKSGALGIGGVFRAYSNAIIDGNVGIGTGDPGAKLEVAGQVKITDGTPGAGKVLTSDATGLASWQAAGGGSLVCVSRSVSQNQLCDTICSNFGEVCTSVSGGGNACHVACPWISCGFCRCCKIQ